MRRALSQGVTAPRHIIPGTTYLVTRRCSERRNFLKPTEMVSQIFLYVLALAARRFHVDVHAFCVLSNHYHLVVTDREARLPAFVQYLDSLVARATNAWLGRWEGFWASGSSYSAVTNEATSDVVRKIAYTLANPVAAGLVASGSDWPGLRSSPAQLASAVTFRAPRPKVFFRPKASMPDVVELSLALPPGFDGSQEFRDAVSAETHALEERARREVAKEGRSFLGRARILAQDPNARPTSREPRRKLNPRVAAIDTWRRLEALSRTAAFLTDYRCALQKLRAGVRDAVFPAGTYLLRVQLGVRCATFA